MKKHNAKILLLDIETAPAKAFVWSLFKTTIAINQIEEPGHTLCFAAQWADHPHNTMQFYSSWRDQDGMLEEAWSLLNEADIVVHYNGKSFDIPTLNREFVLRKVEPPTDYAQVDLLSVVRKQFRFASNKLDFVAQQLGLGAKTQHKGMELWLGCMEGNTKDQKIMERYNKQDVRLLGKLYKRLLPWIEKHPNLGLYMENPDSPTCPNCGSIRVVRWGVRRARTYTYQRYRCQSCGTYSRGRNRLEKPGEGVLV